MSDFTGFVLAFTLGILCGYILRLWIELRAMEAVRHRILDDLCQREKCGQPLANAGQQQGTYKRRSG